MRLRNVGRIAMLVSVAILAISFGIGRPGVARTPVAYAGGGSSESHCRLVGGTVMTNFGAIDQNTTLGTATGDLRGAVSGTILGTPQPGAGNTVVFHVQHHWVTESGDTLSFDPATATTVPLSQTLFAVVTYPLHLTGGTGRFAGATGEINAIGEADLVKGTVFRYSGEVCFAAPGNE